MNARRVFYQAIHPFRKLYWFVVRPRTYGVKCLIECDGKLLLIRNTYGKMHWTFPGGGVGRNELPEAAVRREVVEEVGIQLGEVVYLGHYFNIKEHKRDTVYCSYVHVTNSTFALDAVEIQEAAWFRADALPQPLSPAVTKVLALHRSKSSAYL